MGMMAIQQPERLVAGLQSAKIPVVDEEAQSFLSRLIGVKPSPVRHGLPHGVENVRLRAKDFFVDDKGILRFCYTHDYEALSVVPKGDGLPYPPITIPGSSVLFRPRWPFTMERWS